MIPLFWSNFGLFSGAFAVIKSIGDSFSFDEIGHSKKITHSQKKNIGPTCVGTRIKKSRQYNQ